MNEQEKKSVEEQSGARTEFYYTVKSLAAILTVLVLIFTFVGRIILVDGSSMEPTLRNGEVMLVRSIGYQPKQGDVVVLSKEGFHNGNAIVKRVIATGDQHVRIDYAAGKVFVDDKELDEPYIKEFMVQQYYQTITDIMVPEGSIFVMGDNREKAVDSRHGAVGCVTEDQIIGKLILRIWPMSGFGIVK